MGCTTCSSGGGCGTVGGCKSNGGCSSGGCNRLNSYDWLSGIDTLPQNEKFNYVEVRFKGGRKEFYKNSNFLDLYTGDSIIVETPSGNDFGFVSLQGELVRLQMKKKGSKLTAEYTNIIRKATDLDAKNYEQSKSKELSTLFRARQIIGELKLPMKLSDIEFQMDGKKATFYYSAEDRVDFRELIKSLASEFKIKTEMKQISLRQEAGRLGGIGVCGRELCCSTWLTDFKNVNTSAARYQNLSINPIKLSGQCGRLKCCLNYELDTYMAALKDIPTVEKPINTQIGEAKLQKTDIFRKMMWFSYKSGEDWLPVKTEDVYKLLELNKNGITPNSLDPNDLVDKEDAKINVSLNKDIKQLDDKFKQKRNLQKHSFKAKTKSDTFQKPVGDDSKISISNPVQNAHVNQNKTQNSFNQNQKTKSTLNTSQNSNKANFDTSNAENRAQHANKLNPNHPSYEKPAENTNSSKNLNQAQNTNKSNPNIPNQVKVENNQKPQNSSSTTKENQGQNSNKSNSNNPNNLNKKPPYNPIFKRDKS